MIIPIKRQDYISAQKCDEIVETSLKILQQTGMAAVGETIVNALHERGYKEKNGRFIIDIAQSRAFLELLRGTRPMLTNEINKKCFSPNLAGVVGSYSMYLQQVPSDIPQHFTTDSLISATKFVKAAALKFGTFDAFAPGVAADIDPILESLLKYKISAEHGIGAIPIEPTSLLSAEYIFEMAQLVGQPIERLPVYTISPLCFGGEAADIVLQNKDKLKSFYVFAMPTLGSSTPLSIASGIAMCFAEVLGGAYLMHQITGLTPLIKPNIFPFDFRAMAYAFGSPQKFLYECIAEDFLSQVLDVPVNYHSTNIHTASAVHGLQATMEKTALMTAGALRGANKFYCIGTLSLDEIFSPTQLILDAHLIEQVQQMVSPPNIETLEGAAEDISLNYAGGFITSDKTLDEHEDYLLYSDLVKRNSYNSLVASGQKTMMEQAEATAAQLLGVETSSRLSLEQQKELNKIYSKAKSKL